jgi:hypothetical protein
MKSYGEADVQITIFITSVLVRGERPASRSRRFTPSIHYIGCWVSPRADLDDVERLKY